MPRVHQSPFLVLEAFEMQVTYLWGEVCFFFLFCFFSPLHSSTICAFCTFNVIPHLRTSWWRAGAAQVPCEAAVTHLCFWDLSSLHPWGIRLYLHLLFPRVFAIFPHLFVFSLYPLPAQMLLPGRDLCQRLSDVLSTRFSSSKGGQKIGLSAGKPLNRLPMCRQVMDHFWGTELSEKKEREWTCEMSSMGSLAWFCVEFDLIP